MNGKGTEKTRTLCELHSELLKKEYNCLSLTITFNYRWTTRPFLTEVTRFEIALEVIYHVASVLYGEILHREQVAIRGSPLIS